MLGLTPVVRGPAIFLTNPVLKSVRLTCTTRCAWTRAQILGSVDDEIWNDVSEERTNFMHG